MRKSPTLLAIGGCALLMAFSACSGTSMHWRTTGPETSAVTAGDLAPKVQDCIAINTGTPSKYVCGGRVYTSHELRKMREDAAAKAAIARE